MAEKMTLFFPWNEAGSEGVWKKTPADGVNQFTNMFKICCNFQEFISICKNLSEEQVTEAFNKYDTSGDNK